MPGHTTERSDRHSLNGTRRWLVNGSGQFVDAEADPAWGLSDEIGRLKLADVSPDTEEARLPVHSSRLPAAAAVAQITDNSPLDSSSSNSSSPHTPDQQIHSRGASADTRPRQSSPGNPLLAHPLKNSVAEAKERPRSFSGGLSSADLRRLQQAGDSDDRHLQLQQQWAQSNAEQLSYPSLSNQVVRPTPQPHFNYPTSTQLNDAEQDDRQLDYNASQRQFGSPLVNPAQSPRSQFMQPRPLNAPPTMSYRQTPRSFAPQGPSPLGYGNGHTSHLSLGNTQQLYEMMLPAPAPLENHLPPVIRGQQPHNVFRATHHHSASEPSAIRDPATLALLNNNIQTFGPNMFQPGIPTMPVYPGQFYGAQDMAVQQQLLAARLQAQYNATYALGAPTPAPPNLPMENAVGSPTSSNGAQGGPSANNRKLGLYKTELCRSWEEKGSCRYGGKCQFAHGEEELRRVSRHPKVHTFPFFVLDVF